MERVYADICPGCREKLERLYFLRDERRRYEKPAVCVFCSGRGFFDRVSYVPAKDSKRGGYRA